MTNEIEKPATKPGWRTSEFWLTLAASVLGAAFASGAIGEGGTLAKVLGLAATILTTLGYTVVRTNAKKA